MGQVHYIPVHGEIVIEEADAAPNLETMKKYVGGWIELVHVLHEGQRRQMIVNEEGRLLDLERNERATDIYWNAARARGVDLTIGFQSINPKPDTPPYIHGPAILLVDINLE